VPFTLILDQDSALEEIVSVTAVAGTTLTVTRGVDGTSATSHAAGSSVSHGVSARDFDEPNAHVNTTTGNPHAVTASDVGAVDKTILTAAGQVVASSAASTPAVVAVGSTDGHVLTWDSASAAKMKWAAQKVPAGSMMMYGGTSAPTGWLLCDGASYSTTAYAALFAAIGYTFGGSGSSFNVPDFRSRMPYGSATTGSGLGTTGGATSQTLTISHIPSHTHSFGTISAGSNGSHDHSVSVSNATESAHTHGAGTLTVSTDSGHQHDTRVSAVTSVRGTSAGQLANWAGTNTSNLTASGGSHAHTMSGSTGAPTGHSHTATVTQTTTGSHGHTMSGDTGSAGSATPTAVSTLPPYLTLNFIICAA
jgi:microcystin-dependent protein